MTGPERERCSTRALAFGEPLVGTASRVRTWLAVEQPGRWGPDGIIDSELEPEVASALRERGERAGVRILLIKRRDRPSPGPRRCYAAYTGVRKRRLATFEVADPKELLDLELSDILRLGEPIDGPLFLVCTHGKRDQCCALHGGPLARALAGFADGSTWECTHVGGDRFAGNLVCFPHGLYFGRVGPSDAESVATAYSAGRISLAHFRGRSCYSPAAQAAEMFLRWELVLEGVDDLIPVGHEHLPGGEHAVSFRTPEGSRTVTLQVGRAGPRLVTCKATSPHRPRTFALLGID